MKMKLVKGRELSNYFRSEGGAVAGEGYTQLEADILNVVSCTAGGPFIQPRMLEHFILSLRIDSIHAAYEYQSSHSLASVLSLDCCESVRL